MNGKLYSIGGSNVGTVEEYDPATDTWVFKKPMPTPRSYFSIAAFENKIYCIGGYLNNNSLTGVNEAYDPSTNTWETKAAMPTLRVGLQANVANKRICLIGGYLPPDSPGSNITALSVNEVYNPETDSWTTMSPLPYGLNPIASAVIDDIIFVFGGLYGSSVNANLNLIYEAKTDTWSEGPTPPSYIEYGDAAATTGVNASKRIYVLVEDFESRNETRLWVYDPRGETWMEGAALPTFRMAFGFAVLDDLLYAAGGHIYVTNSSIPFDWSSYYFLDFTTNERYTPFDYGTPDASPIVLPDRAAPKIALVEPKNVTYAEGTVPLRFTVNERVREIAYCLDGAANVTVFGNATLTGLTPGLHNVTVYATDAAGNTGASETACFTVAELEEPFPASLLLAAASIATVAVLGVGFAHLVYYTKRKKQKYS